MAKLADAQALGACERKLVEVQVLSPAPKDMKAGLNEGEGGGVARFASTRRRVTKSSPQHQNLV